MQVDPATLDPKERYRLMISTVIPRPIGWISTLGADGSRNLAPFSYFGAVTSSPMIVMLSVGRRRGEPKDTSVNLLATKEGVVHIAHRPLAEAMVATSAEVAHGVDEFALAGLTPVPSTVVAPPRVGEAAIAMECRLVEHHEVGETPMDVFYLEVVQLHLDDAYLTDGLVDAAKLAAVGRLGGSQYCDTAAPFDIERPA